ncbi:DNA excision repair protein ERCC-4 [Nematocida ausubeli]|nr:DNA excision repair protein ERCC-4 [Nematocida ausubeli]
MHGHEKKIVKEVLSHKRSIHMLYKGIRLGIILKNIAYKSEETLVVIGCTQQYIKKLQNSMQETLKNTKTQRKVKIPREITIKTTSAQRKRIYNESGTVFVNEHIFLLDILKDNIQVSSGLIRVVYAVAERFLPCTKTMMDFILFGFNGPINILFEWAANKSFADIAMKGYFPASGVFLYPAFRKSVIKAFGDLEVNEITIPIDPHRRQIQTELMELARKVKNIGNNSGFREYILKTVASLEFGLFLLHNSPIERFLQYIRDISDISHVMHTLVKLYGISDTIHSRTVVYQHILAWLNLPEIEIILELSQEISKEEKAFPKKALLQKISEEDTLIFIDQPEITRNQEIDPRECYGLDSVPGRICSSQKLISSIHTHLSKQGIQAKKTKKITETRNDPKITKIILMNHSLGFLRKINMCRERWNKKGVEFSVTIINLRDSSEELNYLQEIAAEKDAFLYGIGFKQNRPEAIDKNLYTKEPNNPNAPLLEIDIRELRSSLPLYLAQKFNSQFRLEFKQLPVGDYILNKSYYIERKRIDDFAGSLNNGRLMKQLQALDYIRGSGYLLIEFPTETKISFMSYTNRLQQIDLTSKIITLLETMKTTYIFYSSTERHSSALINALARKPATEITSHKAQSPAVIEALISVPGVNNDNVSIIFKRFQSMHDFITASKERLISALGEVHGTRVYEFFGA